MTSPYLRGAARARGAETVAPEMPRPLAAATPGTVDRPATAVIHKPGMVRGPVMAVARTPMMGMLPEVAALAEVTGPGAGL